jgi:hypothetical protein
MVALNDLFGFQKLSTHKAIEVVVLESAFSIKKR